ncbi:uncharacterized protein LOC126578562 isoform X1 [Anopheles aquasalis]|uniref:uncharacterized protein LOC126578562 isoform X1 n=1 Tax=Anopheles aquasalis TaxID=42839 RepID=UPI00215AF564|nr:uncharacterized protein LOC126578562 isoform X1 [Anopheles aquasalis]
MNLENFFIYVRNLSPFYIFSMVMSIFAVLLTAYFGLTGCSATLDETEASVVGARRNTKSKTKVIWPKGNHGSVRHETLMLTDYAPQENITSARDSAELDEPATISDSDDDSSECSKERLPIETLGQLKSAKLKSIENSLTDEQRKAEKEIERAQLAAIFELLKQQADSSNLDEDDLKEQLSLYR